MGPNGTVRRAGGAEPAAVGGSEGFKGTFRVPVVMDKLYRGGGSRPEIAIR